MREEAAYSLASLGGERERLLATIENLLQKRNPIEFSRFSHPDRLFEALQKAVE